ncbi:putative Ig domain-containing protein [Spirosoma sp. SC4-14]|uniref:putative Ig domain-containing protein n=1 Tax=Spirosoma sp. SC4-14 TaxID=3128900 RepID=UPI0030D5A379
MNRPLSGLSCLLGCLLLATVSLGQDGSSAPLMASYQTATNRLKLLPPNVASMERYGNVPINFSSGQLNYSLPIHTIDVDNTMSMPIQLTYNNSGLKPDEVPSWVGNGWDLHLGGTIVQTINGMDDFDGTAGLQVQASRDALNAYILGNGSMSLTDQYQYCDAVVKNFKDSQFDTFSLTLPGKSGKFYFDKASDGSPKAVFYSQQPLRVAFANNQFTITDERGNVYLFTESIDGAETYSNAPFYTDSDPYRLSSKTWYLTKITTASGVEAVITYKDDTTYELWTTNYSCNAPTAGAYTCGAQNSTMTVRQKLVSQISWKGKKVVFETIDRNDLNASGTSGAKAQALSRIKVYNESNELVRQIGFTYDNRSRLQLSSLSFLDKVTGNQVQTYSFAYYGDAGPIAIPYLSKPAGPNPANNAIDHWGYYNGKQNTSKIPASNYTTLTGIAGQPSLATANRSSDGNFSLYGMLKRITYPTQGYTEITYEPNRVTYPSMTQVPYFMRDQDVLSGYTAFAQDANSDCNQKRKTGTLVIAQNLVGVRFRWELQGYSYAGNNAGSSFQFSNSAGQILVSDVSAGYKTGSTRIDLPAGTYSYTLIVGCQTPASAPVPPTDTVRNGTSGVVSVPASLASFTAEKPQSGDITLAVGGNRVQRIIDNDQTTGYNERVITYTQASLLHEPYYVTNHQTPGTIGSANACISLGKTYVVNERSIYNWDGFHVLYKQVTESLGQGGANGQKSYTFDDPYYLGTSYTQAPYPPAQNLPWRTGNLLAEGSYQKNANSTFDLVAKSSTSYTSGQLGATVKGVKVDRILACPVGSIATTDLVNSYFTVITIPAVSDQFGVGSRTQEQWFSGTLLSQSTQYAYNQDWLVNQITTINSQNQTEKVLTYYANDYDNSAGSTIASLKGINAIGVPLKTVRTINDKAVDGVITLTDAAGNPTELYRLEVAAPATLTHSRTVYVPAEFAKYESRQYSSKGNITQVIPRNGPTRTYVWAYNHTYPVAEVLNATQAQVEAVGGSLESAAMLTDLTAIQNLTNGLRSGLSQALVNSTTMFSGVGVRQLTNPAGLSSSYEYDNLGRLQRIKNNRLETVKEYTYNYAPGIGSGSARLATNSISTQTIRRNEPYSYPIPNSLFASTLGQSVQYSLSGLPAGLSFVDGQIMGTPTQAGTYLIIITATNAAGLSSSTSYNLVVNP